MSEEKIRVGIIQGDINGVGLEIILKTFAEPELTDICTPVLFSSQKTVSYYRKVTGMEDLSFNAIRDLKQIQAKRTLLYCH